MYSLLDLGVITASGFYFRWQSWICNFSIIIIIIIVLQYI